MRKNTLGTLTLSKNNVTNGSTYGDDIGRQRRWKSQSDSGGSKLPATSRYRRSIRVRWNGSLVDKQGDNVEESLGASV